jgi:hypothetical protein
MALLTMYVRAACGATSKLYIVSGSCGTKKASAFRGFFMEP